ncbi:MAG TPA: Hsp20/alpha crystallin family protein [Desulfitobacteriaceae bacterium]|nr:Hsp20/alpha crystallin family protein [Desulfitobacteriaceae bacterium]
MFNLVPFAGRNSGIQRSRDLFNIEDIFENFFNDRFFPSLYKNSSQMKVDIKETEKEYILEVELPGIKKEEVNLEIDEGRLTISVRKDEQKEDKQDNYIRKERSFSAMTRSFEVSDVETDGIDAKFENGLLLITLPKKQEKEVKGRKIEIN